MHTFLVPVNFDYKLELGCIVCNPINKFDTTQTTALTPIETDLATMDSWISNIESLFTDGVTDINFPMERWTALSAENSLKTDLAHRTAEMAGVGGMTGVNGQPGMMLGADAGGGNSVMYPQSFGFGAGDLYGTGAYSLPGMSSQASPLHDAGINGATMYGSSAIITASGKSVAGQVTSTSATAVEKPKKKKNKVLGFLKDAADFLILDDVKTVFDPKASFLDKGVAIFSVTLAGKAVKVNGLKDGLNKADLIIVRRELLQHFYHQVLVIHMLRFLQCKEKGEKSKGMILKSVVNST